MNSLLDRAGTFVRGLNAGRRLLFAWFAGAISALGFVPFDIFPLLLLGYAALVLLIDGAQSAARPIRASALAGLAFGFGQFLVGLHWVGYAFLVDPGAHEWQIPFVAVLFPGGLALFTALACAVAAQGSPGSTRTAPGRGTRAGVGIRHAGAVRAPEGQVVLPRR